MKLSEPWLALVIGNTRLHWGYFYQESFLGGWHTPHLTEAIAAQLQQARFTAEAWECITEWETAYTDAERASLPRVPLGSADIWVASAVPAQAELWQQPHRMANIVVRSHIPLSDMYSTLGIDRAINLLGAGSTVGWPVLVIDAGTAITLTAGVDSSFDGGAILPGLRLQQAALAQKTASLSAFVSDAGADWEGRSLPARWATDSVGAIASGLIYGITATVADYLADWWQQFPAGEVILTGGDAPQLHRYLQKRYSGRKEAPKQKGFSQKGFSQKNSSQERAMQKRTPEIDSRVQVNRDLMFYGMQVYRKRLL